MRWLPVGLVALAVVVLGAGIFGGMWWRENAAEAARASVPSATPYAAWRPCTLFTPEEVASVAKRPVHQIMSDNRVLGESVICSYSVGEGGMHGLAQVAVVHPADGDPGGYLARRCVDASLADGACRLPSGLLVRQIGGVVAEVSVQSMMGMVQPEETDALMALVAPRLEQAS